MSTSVVSPVFVGRQEEFAVLAALLERVQRGEPAFAVIGGEAGVGKTRLVGELAARAASAGFTVPPRGSCRSWSWARWAGWWPTASTGAAS